VNSRRVVISISATAERKIEMENASLAFLGKKNLSRYFNKLHEINFSKKVSVGFEMNRRIELLLISNLARLDDMLTNCDYNILTNGIADEEKTIAALEEMSESVKELYREFNKKNMATKPPLPVNKV